ncbi:hypothetical protein ASE48_19775 [Mycobacterium sp. Root265]|uniref:GGDEF domain-containing protein n=1 Tax=Mycobacterium sp. Root265 TaxID=1736504 RepID=UPI00070ADE1F|nr:GGDEF domain-containing protein [Mycobacterium sp. Root265]KRD04891.1 hypothetical protein ASE48_19775 [Mycobacterium sp. Root265]
MGRREYVFATNSLRAGHFMRVFMLVAGLGCIGLAVLGGVMQLHPEGPAGVTARSVQGTVLISAVVIGVYWWRAPWPSFGQSVAFVVWADLACAMVAVTMATPAARLSMTSYVGLIGIFAGFILGTQILRLHCAFSALLIGGIVVWAVLEDHSVVELFIYFMPAFTWAVGVPLISSVLIELGRRAILTTARSAHYDSLTRLRNRRGMYSAVASALRQGGSTTVAVAVCDIDRFKQLNDDGGHAAGDAALVALADLLRDVARDDEITARIGGDELALVSFLGDRGSISELVDRVSVLTRVRGGAVEFSVSFGIATMPSADAHFAVDDVLRHADAAMYDAKRSGGAACAVYATESTTAASAARRHGRDRPA